MLGSHCWSVTLESLAETQKSLVHSEGIFCSFSIDRGQKVFYNPVNFCTLGEPMVVNFGTTPVLGAQGVDTKKSMKGGVKKSQEIELHKVTERGPMN
jgi:hypothetical protein